MFELQVLLNKLEYDWKVIQFMLFILKREMKRVYDTDSLNG